MAQYTSLAELRGALTTDDAGRRSDAYSAVLGNDIEPTAVLSDDPPKQELEEVGVIPPSEVTETRQDILEDIRDILAEAHGVSL